MCIYMFFIYTYRSVYQSSRPSLITVLLYCIYTKITRIDFRYILMYNDVLLCTYNTATLHLPTNVASPLKIESLNMSVSDEHNITLYIYV